MKITPLTIIICMFAVFSLVRLLRRLARDGMALRSSLVWIITWLSLAVFSIFPDLLNEIVAAAGMENRLFFLLTIAVLVLAALLFNLTSRFDRMHRDIGLAIRELAIANFRIDCLERGEAHTDRTEPGQTQLSPGNAAQEPIGSDAAAMRDHPLDHSRQ